MLSTTDSTNFKNINKQFNSYMTSYITNVWSNTINNSDKFSAYRKCL